MNYVRVCPGCDLLFHSTRRDQIACDGRCRVRLHRSEAWQKQLAMLEAIGGEPALMGEIAALKRLCPELAPHIMARTAPEGYQAMTGRHGRQRETCWWRVPLWKAFFALIARHVKPKTTIVNVKGRKDADAFVYVGRRMRFGLHTAGSVWGNPFKVGRDGTLAEVLAKYRAHVLGSPDLLVQLHTLRGKVLGCWCCDGDASTPSPAKCHAQVLAELADGPLGDPPG